MRINGLALLNFKAFDDLELPLGALTLLSGLNGSGKSSVVQALGLLRQSYDQGTLADGEIALNGPLVEIGTGHDVLHQGFAAQVIGIRLTLEDGSEREWEAPAPSQADVLECSIAPTVAELADVNLFGPGLQYIRADRIVPAVTFPKSQHAVVHNRSLGPQGAYAPHFLLRAGIEAPVVNELPDRSTEASDAADGTSLLARVNDFMQAFSPGVRIEVAEVPMTDLVRLEFSFQGSGAAYGERLRPTNVGFGLTHVLPVVTACLAAQPGTLVIVENPEAQLHPRGQSALGRLLAATAAGGVQVVVETHSDHVLNGIRLAARLGEIRPDATQLHFFSRVPGGGASRVTPELDSAGRLSFWPEGFFDQWERDLDRLLD